jgi:tetratricopeptide (TPR) repeat protein
MTIFKRMFGRDCRYYMDKGSIALQAERYAEARDAFAEALEKLDRTAPEAAALELEIKAKTAVAGNRLAAMNIEEARYLMGCGERAKASEHLDLAVALAEDGTIREMAEQLHADLRSKQPEMELSRAKNACAGCTPGGAESAENNDVADDQLSAADRFHLLVQPLPGNLAERYEHLGEKFASGYLLANSGDNVTAHALFTELQGGGENDILLYEIALLRHREGDLATCEELLRRALVLNEANPLCHLALVHLLTETGRFEEAGIHLEAMIAREILPDQARMMLGDVHLEVGDESKAIATYSELLQSPFGKEAAGKLIPLLKKCGRLEEAAYLYKRFKKGCC